MEPQTMTADPPRPLPPGAPPWSAPFAEAAALLAFAGVAAVVSLRAADTGTGTRWLVGAGAAILAAFALFQAAFRIAETAGARRVLRRGRLIHGRILRTERVSVWRDGRPSRLEGGALDVYYAVGDGGAEGEERLEADRVASLGRIPHSGDPILVAELGGHRPLRRIWSLAQPEEASR
jgi:hypothetical protein